MQCLVIPTNYTPYKQTPVFTEISTPKGLRHSHQTKAGVWGKIFVLEGQLKYVIEEPSCAEFLLDSDTEGIIEPAMKHYVTPLGRVKFFVEFYKQA